SCAHNAAPTSREISRETSASADNRQVIVDSQSNSFKVQNNHVPTVEARTRPLFDWPVWEARMTRGYLPRVTKKRRRPHRGIDLAAPRGSAVMSSHDGVVIYTGSGFRGYGKM